MAITPVCQCGSHLSKNIENCESWTSNIAIYNKTICFSQLTIFRILKMIFWAWRQNLEIHRYHLPNVVSILAQYHNKARLRGLSNVEELLIASPRSNNVTQDTHLAFMLLYALCLTLKAQSDISFSRKKISSLKYHFNLWLGLTVGVDVYEPISGALSLSAPAPYLPTFHEPGPSSGSGSSLRSKDARQRTLSQASDKWRSGAEIHLSKYRWCDIPILTFIYEKCRIVSANISILPGSNFGWKWIMVFW